MKSSLKLALAGSILAVSACAEADKNEGGSAPTQDQTNAAQAFPAGSAGTLISPAGNELGSLQASEGGGGVTLLVDARGLQPGTHGVAIHSTGECRGPNFVSAGPSIEPVGNLPNVEVGSDGLWKGEVKLAGLRLADLRDSDGSALVLHMNPENPPADRSGNAGDRIACAVI